MKFHKLLIILICLLSLSAIAGLAHANVVNESLYLSPRYQYTAAISTSLDISGGQAMAAGRIDPNSLMRTSVVVKLQRLESGTWKTIRTWTDSNTAGASEAGGTKTVDSGYDYRVHVTGKVYNTSGVVLETVTMTSSTKSY